MAKGYLGVITYKGYLGNIKMKKGYIGSTMVYSAGNICTYHVNTNEVYTEEIDEGESCLSPISFTPTLSGWTFIGWREDNAANGTVLTSKIMGDSPITLYAVFRQTITLAYAGNGATSGSTTAQTGYRYYNNGNVVNPSFTVKTNGFARSGYLFTGWKSGNTDYAVGQTVTLSSNLTLAAQWYTTAVTNFGYTGGIQTYTVPATGLYLLKLYGSAGHYSNKGDSGAVDAGGQGGTTTQYVVLTKGTVLYIVCGGMGGRAWDDSVPGGYNGGGKGHSSGNWWVGSGGGCTHIAKISGTLHDIGASRKSQVLAVAGGGGGRAGGNAVYRGGGTSGESSPYGSAGTQTSGYAFGLGGPPNNTGGGTGGGLYGGVGNNNGALSGSGGSGYIMSATTTFKGKTYNNSTVIGGNASNGSASVQLIAA